MNLPSVSVCMTINDRKPEVVDRVFESFKGQDFQQMVICFDRPEGQIKDHIDKRWKDDPRYTPVVVEGEKGHLCPARAWNRAFEAVQSEITYCISSEVIQGPQNVQRAKEMMRCRPIALFGKCVDSQLQVQYEDGRMDNTYCSTQRPRPLGFVMALPTWALRTIGGYDEAFMPGFCYEDDDFTYRLWSIPLDFVFDDNVHGVHQYHPRGFMSNNGGQEKVRHNERLFIDKWGAARPLKNEMDRGDIFTETINGILWWRHR